MSAEPATALPVRVAAGNRLASEVVPHLEGALGWQVTRDDELPAVLALVGVGVEPPGGLPRVLLVRDDDPPDRAARSAVDTAAVLRWPGERDRLGEVAATILARLGSMHPGTATVRLGGAAGGVGTTTVTLCLGGLLAWNGKQALVVASGDVPVPDVPLVDPSALNAHRTWDAAARVPGVDGLRVVATTPGPRAAAVVPDGTVVLRDDGVATDVDVLVCTRTRAGIDALEATAASVAVVGDHGPIPAGRWRRTAPAHVRQLAVGWSTRVARAGVVRRVPASVPGRWLAGLAALARSITQGSS